MKAYRWALLQFDHAEIALFSEWCSRAHIAAKGALDDVGRFHELCTTDDRRGLKQQSKKRKYPAQSSPDQLDVASQPGTFSFHTDVASAYNGFLIAPESRRFFTFWQPAGPRASDGWVWVQRKRMPFGWINSSSFMNANYDEMVAELPQSVKDRLARYFDDMALRGLNDFEEFYAAVEQLLLACIKYGLFFDRYPRRHVASGTTSSTASR